MADPNGVALNLFDQMKQQSDQVDRARQQNNINITLNLTLAEVNAVLQVLNTGPFNQVLPLINKITSQAQEAVK